MRKIDKDVKKLNDMLANGQIDEATYNRQISSITEEHSIDYDNSSFIENNILKILLIPIVIIIVIIIAILLGKSIKTEDENIKDEVVKTKNGISFYYNSIKVEIQYVSKYSISGKVVTKKKYNSANVIDKIIPIDIGLAWGKLEYEKYHEMMAYSAGNRGMHILYLGGQAMLDELGGEEYIQIHTSNNHLIPANDEILKKLNEIKLGKKIYISGYLANVIITYSDGSKKAWNSSTSKTDTGKGACETIYVTNIY